jgi:hypothetical protein
MEDGSCAAAVRIDVRFFLCSSCEDSWKMIPVQQF